MTTLADGIAFSTDGRIWQAGAGGYGNGWGDVGEGVSVPAGSTVYIKYYSGSRDGSLLNYAAHGAEWGNWRAMGPVLAGNVGRDPGSPVILQVKDIGTSKSAVMWLNGTGTWGGIQFPGAYDFGLQRDALWTRPPLIVRATEAPPWWAAFWRPSGPSKAGPTSPEGVPVPDGGGTALLLGCALLSVALVWCGLRRRGAKRHGPPPGQP